MPKKVSQHTPATWKSEFLFENIADIDHERLLTTCETRRPVQGTSDEVRIYWDAPKDWFDKETGDITYNGLVNARDKGWRLIESRGIKFILPADKVTHLQISKQAASLNKSLKLDTFNMLYRESLVILEDIQSFGKEIDIGLTRFRNAQSAEQTEIFELSKKYDSLIAGVDFRELLLSDFLAMLHKIELDEIEIILRNLADPDNDNRLPVQVLKDKYRLRLSRKSLYHWEDKLTKLCERCGWKIKPPATRSHSISVGKHREAVFDELVRKAKPGSEGLETFLKQLQENGLSQIFIILENMTRPGNGGRIRIRNLHDSGALEISRITAERWEARLEKLATSMNWEVAKRPSKSAILIDAARERRIFSEIRPKARPETSGLRRFLEMLKSRGLFDRAIILENVTMPPNGVRLSSPQLKENFNLGVVYQTIVKWENYFEKMANTLGWPIAPRPKNSRKISRGTRRRSTFKHLAAEAKPGINGLTAFINALSTNDLLELATILKNITEPAAGKRKTADELKKTKGLSLSIKKIQEWESTLEKLCAGNNWPVSKTDAVRLKYNSHPQMKTFYDLASKFSLEKLPPKEFIERLKVAGLKNIAIILENLVLAETGERKTPIKLIEDSDIKMAEITILRWEKRLEILANENGWPVKEKIGQSKALTVGRRRQMSFDKILETASPGIDGLSEFMSRLESEELTNVLIILKNITMPFEGTRRHPRQLKSEYNLSFRIDAVRLWDKRLEKLARDMDWPVIKKPGKSGESHHGKKRIKQFEKIKHTASAGSDGLNAFLEALKKSGLNELYEILKNLTQPEGGSRRSAAEIREALNLPLAGSTIRVWETKFESLCVENNWPLAAFAGHSQKISSGEKRFKILQQLLPQAEEGTSGLHEFIDLLEKNGLHEFAHVLKNMTEPENGERLQARELKAKFNLSVNKRRVSSWENIFEELAHNKRWPLLEKPYSSEASSIGKKRGRLLKQLQAEAISGEEGSAAFLKALRSNDLNQLAVIFENVTAPRGGTRLTHQQLFESGQLALTYTSYLKWEKSLERFAKKMDWRIVSKNEQSEMIVAAYRRLKLFDELAENATNGNDGLQPFIAKLNEAGMNEIAIIMENLTTPTDGKRRSARALQKEKQISLNLSTIRKWQNRLLKLCKENQWSIKLLTGSQNSQLMSDPFFIQTLWHMGEEVAPHIESAAIFLFTQLRNKASNVYRWASELIDRTDVKRTQSSMADFISGYRRPIAKLSSLDTRSLGRLKDTKPEDKMSNLPKFEILHRNEYVRNITETYRTIRGEMRPERKR